MPQSTYMHGWFPLPTETRGFQEALYQIPETTLDYLDVDLGPQLEFFTDGSCKEPGDNINRFSAWAVVVTSDKDWWNFQPLSPGLVRGKLQTVVRAELTAVKSAIQYALQVWRPIRLWVDNQHVCNVVRKMASLRYHVSPKKPNHDLLSSVQVLLTHALPLFRGIVKVVSHQDHRIADPVERWAFAGNDAADHVAEMAYFSFPKEHQLWCASSRALKHARRLKQKFHDMLIAIGKCCTMKNKTSPEAAPKEGYLEPRALVMSPWQFPDVLPEGGGSYMIPEYQAMVRWIRSLHGDEGSVQRWSWCQLTLDAIQMIPDFGPWYQLSAKQWQSGQLKKGRKLQDMAKSFALWMTRVSKKVLGLQLPMRYCQPTSTILCFGTQTLPVVVPQARANHIQ